MHVVRKSFENIHRIYIKLKIELNSMEEKYIKFNVIIVYPTYILIYSSFYFKYRVVSNYCGWSRLPFGVDTRVRNTNHWSVVLCGQVAHSSTMNGT